MSRRPQQRILCSHHGGAELKQHVGGSLMSHSVAAQGGVASKGGSKWRLMLSSEVGLYMQLWLSRRCGLLLY
jgi:hypothetical protein